MKLPNLDYYKEKFVKVTSLRNVLEGLFINYDPFTNITLYTEQGTRIFVKFDHLVSIEEIKKDDK